MALIICRECGAEVFSLAKTCPKCGAPINYISAPVAQTNSDGKSKSIFTSGGIRNIIGGLGFYLFLILLVAPGTALEGAGMATSSDTAISPIGGSLGDIFWSLTWVILSVVTVLSFILILYKSMDKNTAFILCAVQLALSILSILLVLRIFGWAIVVGVWMFMWPMVFQLIGSALCMSAASKARNAGGNVMGVGRYREVISSTTALR